MIWINMSDSYNRRILSIFNAPRGLPDLQLVVQIAIILQQELNDIKKLLLKYDETNYPKIKRFGLPVF